MPGEAELPAPLLPDRSLPHEIHVRKLFGEIRVPFSLNAALVRPTPARGALAILAVELVNHIHAGAHLAERSKAEAIEPVVVAEVDEHLRGARVGTRGREG